MARLKIVHLSDCHFRVEQGKSSELVQPLLKAVSASARRSDTVVLAVTGDLAFSGSSEEYLAAERILSSIHSGLESLSGAVVTTLIVPGNHDCNFREDSAARKAVLRSIVPGADWDPSIPATATAIQAHFFQFAARAARSGLKFDLTELISEWRLKLGARDIAFWGLNSAWMSQLKERPGSIWFPVHLLQERIAKAESALNILLLHHPFSWFSPEIRRSFLTMADMSFDLVLAGHEHVPEAWARDDLEGGKTLIVEGGVFQEDGPQLDGSSFNVADLDLDTSIATLTSYEFIGELYVPAEPRFSSFASSGHTAKSHRRISAKFLSYLRSAGATFTHPRKSGKLELQEFYIEPDLVDMDDTSTTTSVEKHVSTRDVLAQVHVQPYVVVGGAEKSGKSAWLRWAYLHLHSLGFTPVRVEGASIKHGDLDRMLKLIDREYRQQYEALEAVGWTQLEFRLRALLIDDFHSCQLNRQARSKLLSELTMKFGVVLVTCDDALLMEVRCEDSEFDGFQRYQIPEMGHRLRDVLIGRWLRIGKSGTMTQSAFQVQREQRVRAINLILGQSFIPSRPIFLLTLLQSMELGADAAIRGSSLGEYYEYLIRHALIGARVDARDLDAVLNYLTELGYFFVDGDRSHVDSGELGGFDSNFAERYALKIRFDSLHRQLQEADILEDWNDQIRFKYRYVLLFFGARYLARHFGSDVEVTRQVRAVAGNLSTAKYADLMLFIVHHQNDSVVLDLVLQQARAAFADVTELRLDYEDVRALNELVLEIPLLALSDECKEKRRERTMRSRDEAAAAEKGNGKSDGGLSLSTLQEDDSDRAMDHLQKLTYGLRLLGILGQVLRNYYGSLRAERKEQIAATGYALVARMLRSQLDIICGDRDALIAHLAQALEKRGAQTPERAKSLANRLIFGLGSLIVFVFVKRAAEFLGSDKLLPTHRRVSGAVDTPLSRLLGLAVALDYPAAGSSGEARAVPVDEVEGIDGELKSNPCAAWVLRRLVLDYLYMFEVSFKDKHKICEALNISIRTQQRIQLMSQRKK